MTQPRQSLRVALTIETRQPLTFTHHGVEGLPLLTRGVDSEGRHLRTVYIPAGQLRGRLRHEAALHIMRTRSSPSRLEDAYLLALGQDLRPDEDGEPEVIRLKEQKAFREAHPFLDLFGTWKVASRLFVSHLLPPVNVAPDRISHIRRDLDTNEQIMAELDEAEQDRLYERQNNQSLASRTENMIKATTRSVAAARKAKDQTLLATLEAKLKELQAIKQAHKGDDESDNTKHLLEVELIPAGLGCLGSLTVQSARAQDLSTLVTAIEGLGRDPFLGAQRARGCGNIAGEATFSGADGQVLAVTRFDGSGSVHTEWTMAGHDFVREAEAVTA